AKKKPDPAEIAAVETIFGADAAKNLGIKSARNPDSYHIVSYSLSDKEKSYPAMYNLGQGDQLSFCDAYIDLLDAVLVKGRDQSLPWVTHAPDKLKVLNYLMYSASRAIQGLPHDSDESRFFKRGAEKLTPAEVTKESLGRAGLDKVKTAFDGCRMRRDH